MEAWPLVVENFRCKGGHADLTVTCKLCLGFVGLLFENRNLKKKSFTKSKMRERFQVKQIPALRKLLLQIYKFIFIYILY